MEFQTENQPELEFETEPKQEPENQSQSKPQKFLRAVFPLFYSEKNERNAYIACVLSFVVTLFLLFPLDLYFNNFTDFNVPFTLIIRPLAAVSLLLTAGLLVLVPAIFRKGVYEVLGALLMGVTLSSCVQALFLNRSMSKLTGDSVNYSEVTTSRTINVIVWCVIALLPLVARIIMKQRKLNGSVLMFGLSIVLVGMNTFGLIPAIFKYNGKSVGGEHYFSYDKTFELSSQGNICVFVLDRLDVKYMRTALAENPTLYERLDGFTFYENNVSLHTNTFPAMTYLLTGVDYQSDNKSWSDYWDEAWGSHNYIDELRNNGYNSNLLIDRPTTYGSSLQIAERSDNIIDLNSNKGEIKIRYPTIAETTLRISMSKAVPYYLKKPLIDKYDSGFSNAFHELSDYSDHSLVYPAVTNETDGHFYENLKKIGLHTQNETKTFTFVHFNGAHVRNAERTDALESIFNTLDEYFNQMKDLGIYDSSTIIITTDHGRPPAEIERGESELEGEITAALLIKPQNSRGRLESDTRSELSHVNFVAAILQSAGLPHEDYGTSYFDIIESGEAQTRTLYINRWFRLGNIDRKGRYEIIGDANDFDNWVFVPPS
ncbi:MAG: hypothetical protein FWG83_01205 [Oscillospiraceae bacterium]|nr:hypothetical protein [Oscillospiraceae bacterium]